MSMPDARRALLRELINSALNCIPATLDQITHYEKPGTVEPIMAVHPDIKLITPSLALGSRFLVFPESIYELYEGATFLTRRRDL